MHVYVQNVKHLSRHHVISQGLWTWRQMKNPYFDG